AARAGPPAAGRHRAARPAAGRPDRAAARSRTDRCACPCLTGARASGHRCGKAGAPARPPRAPGSKVGRITVQPVDPYRHWLPILGEAEHARHFALLAQLLGGIDREQQGFALAPVGSELVAVERDEPDVLPARDEIARPRRAQDDGRPPSRMTLPTTPTPPP